MSDKPAPGVPAVTPLVQLPSGAILRVENINFIARQELNKYGVFYPQMANAAIVDRRDIDTLLEFGIIQKLEPANPAPEETLPPKVIAAA